MGRLIRKPGSPFLIARFYANGKDVSRSTKTADRKEAAKNLRRWEAAARGESVITENFRAVLQGLTALEAEAKDDRVALAELKRQRQSMAAQILREAGGGIAIAEAWQIWIDTPRKRVPKACTMASYKAEWKRFATWCTKRGFKDLREIGALEVEDYTRNLARAGLAPRSYNGHVKFLRAFFRVLRLRAGLADNPFESAVMMEGATLSRRELTHDELAKVFEKATGSKRVMIAVGVFTGLRLGDVCRLKWASVDLNKNIMTVVPGKTERKGRIVTIPLHPTLVSTLQAWRQVTPGPEVFPEEAAQYIRDAALVSNAFQDIFTACGITTTEKVTGRKLPRILVSFHSLRHSFVSLAAAAGAPQHVIQALVGHGSPAMTSHYTHVDADQRRKAIEALPELSIASAAKPT
jgi:integrase